MYICIYIHVYCVYIYIYVVLDNLLDLLSLAPARYTRPGIPRVNPHCGRPPFCLIKTTMVLVLPLGEPEPVDMVNPD